MLCLLLLEMSHAHSLLSKFVGNSSVFNSPTDGITMAVSRVTLHDSLRYIVTIVTMHFVRQSVIFYFDM